MDLQVKEGILNSSKAKFIVILVRGCWKIVYNPIISFSINYVIKKEFLMSELDNVVSNLI